MTTKTREFETDLGVSAREHGGALPQGQNSAGRNERLETPFMRFATAVAPASVITFGLFAVMAGLIATEYAPAEAAEAREISTITPQETDIDKPATKQPVNPLQLADAPPPPPRFSVTKGEIKIDVQAWTGGAPSNAGFQTVEKIVFSPVAIADRPLQAIRPPLPTYPARALDRGMEGECAVQLDVDPRGRPFNVEAVCTDPVFTRAAESAVRKAQFVPEVASGQPVVRRNVVYPLNFSLSD